MLCLLLSLFSCVRLFATPGTVDHQAPMSKRFSRQEYWSGLPHPAPGDLPYPGPVSSKRYPSRLESRAGFFASTRDGGLSPRVRLECNPEIPLVHPVSSKRYPSRLESRAGYFASTRDECLYPRVRLECNPVVPVAPGEEHLASGHKPR